MMKQTITLPMFVIALSLAACGTIVKANQPTYDIDSSETLVAWCPAEVCPDSRFHLNRDPSANDPPQSIADRLWVYHGTYCKLIEKMSVDDYLWTGEDNVQTRLTFPVDVYLVECDNSYRRAGDGKTEYFEGSMKTLGWAFPTDLLPVAEWDRLTGRP